MSCILSSGYSIGCKNQSGVQKVFIGTYNDDAMTFTLDADNKITATGGTHSGFYTFAQPVETASLSFPGEVSTENNAYAFNTALMITLSGVDAALLNKIKTLVVGVWRIIVLDAQGNYFLMGLNKPVQASALEGGLGKASTDLSGAVLTFSVKDTLPIYQMDAAVAKALIV